MLIFVSSFPLIKTLLEREREGRHIVTAMEVMDGASRRVTPGGVGKVRMNDSF